MSIPSEDKTDFEKVIDAYLINWDNDNKSRREMAIDLLTQEIEPLRLKLKEKEQEIAELTELRENGAYNCSLLMVQLGEEKVKLSKLEQSNKALVEALKVSIQYMNADDPDRHRFKTLIQSEGTTKKE